MSVAVRTCVAAVVCALHEQLAVLSHAVVSRFAQICTVLEVSFTAYTPTTSERGIFVPFQPLYLRAYCLLSLSLSLSLSVCLSVRLSVCLSLSISLCFYRSIYLSIYLSIPYSYAPL